jgi:Flavodoxin domain
MKAVVLYESLTGNTRKAGELIATKLQESGVGITDVGPVRRPDLAAIQAADLVIVGTWVHGLFVIGQAPFGVGALQSLPAISGKQVATYCTFALDPKHSLDKMARALEYRGGQVIGGLALNRSKLDQHSEEFVGRLLANVSTV